jgi:hypothetical protein
VFDRYVAAFDSDQGRLHGLVHLYHGSACFCPACVSRNRSN